MENQEVIVGKFMGDERYDKNQNYWYVKTIGRDKHTEGIVIPVIVNDEISSKIKPYLVVGTIIKVKGYLVLNNEIYRVYASKITRIVPNNKNDDSPFYDVN